MSHADLSQCVQHHDWTTSLGATSAGTVSQQDKMIIMSKYVMMIFNSAVDNQIFVSMCSPARDLSQGYHAVWDLIAVY